MSIAMSATPTQIAMSATLNVGQWSVTMCAGYFFWIELVELLDPVGAVVDEVDDVAVADAVEHVAERAAEDERQAPLQRVLPRLEAPIERDDERDRRDRDEQEERPADVLALPLEQTPRAALVLREDEHEVVVDDVDVARVALELLLGPELRDDVRGERDDRDDREERRRRTRSEDRLRDRAATVPAGRSSRGTPGAIGGSSGGTRRRAAGRGAGGALTPRLRRGRGGSSAAAVSFGGGASVGSVIGVRVVRVGRRASASSRRW